MALKSSDVQNRFGWIFLTYMAPGLKVSGFYPEGVSIYDWSCAVPFISLLFLFSSSLYHRSTKKISPKETSHVLFHENRSGFALPSSDLVQKARRDKIRMWCDARSYEEVLSIAELSGWVYGVPMGSDLMHRMWRWRRKGQGKVDEKF